MRCGAREWGLMNGFSAHRRATGSYDYLYLVVDKDVNQGLRFLTAYGR
jgi:hypothetical protein